jgi:hypothetical protein
MAAATSAAAARRMLKAMGADFSAPYRIPIAMGS